jgi:hypothetical protein
MNKTVSRTAALLLCLSPALSAAYGDERSKLTPPEIVRVENVRLEEGVKIIIVGNDNGRYVLSCNIKASGCMTPLPGIDYFVFKNDTRWKLQPEAKEFMTLQFMQDWTESYNDAENIGLMITNPHSRQGGPSFGVYILVTTTHPVATQQASLDLQEKCGKQAQIAFNKMTFENKPQASFINHYNVKLNRCFIQTEEYGRPEKDGTNLGSPVCIRR